MSILPSSSEVHGAYLSKEGISPVKNKLDAIRLAPRPKDVSQLRVELLLKVY